MSFTQRNRRQAYDNIASGQATGAERPISGESVTVVEIYGGGKMTSTSTGESDHSNIAAGTTVSEEGGPDNMTVAVDPTDERTGSSNSVGFVTNP